MSLPSCPPFWLIPEIKTKKIFLSLRFTYAICPLVIRLVASRTCTFLIFKHYSEEFNLLKLPSAPMQLYASAGKNILLRRLSLYSITSKISPTLYNSSSSPTRSIVLKIILWFNKPDWSWYYWWITIFSKKIIGIIMKFDILEMRLLEERRKSTMRNWSYTPNRKLLTGEMSEGIVTWLSSPRKGEVIIG